MPSNIRLWAGASLAGALLPMAFAPFHLWPLALLSPALLLWCLLRVSGARQAFVCGWLFGLGLWLAGLYWVYFSIHNYGGASAVVAGLLTLAFAGGLALLQAGTALLWYWLHSGHRLHDCLLLFPACWVLGEWVKGWLLTGLPWLDLGTTAVDWWAGGWLPVLGVAGVGWLLAGLAGGAVFAWNKGWQLRPLRLQSLRLQPWLAVGGGALLLTVGGWLLQQQDWVEETGRSMRIRLIQTNISAYERWQQGGLEKSLTENLRLTGAGEQLVVWPETSLPMRDDWPGADRLIDFLDERFAERGQTLALGLLHSEGDAVFNSLMLVGKDEGVYHKSRLVPFGEFTPAVLMPLRSLFQFPASDMRPGPEQPAAVVVAGTPLAIAICYEIAYGRLLLPRAAAAGLILTTSNDSWFGRSTGPWQHLQIARVRSAESRRWTLRSTNGGIGGVIDSRGKMRRTLKPFESDGLSVTVPIATGGTPASYLPSWLYALLALTLLAGLRWRSLLGRLQTLFGRGGAG